MTKRDKTIIYIGAGIVLLGGAYYYFIKPHPTSTAPSGNDSYGNPYTYRGYSIQLTTGGVGGAPGTFVGVDSATRGWLDEYLTNLDSNMYSTLTGDASANHFNWVPSLPAPKANSSSSSSSSSSSGGGINIGSIVKDVVSIASLL